MEQKSPKSAVGGATTTPHADEYEAGNDADFERLYQNSYGKTLGTLTAMLGDRAAAEDCVQDAFERAYKKWPDWQPIAPAEAWVHRIAINAAVSHLRKMRIRELGELIRRLGRPGLGPDPQVLAEHSDLADALAKLPLKQRATIVLRHYHGYTNRAISQATGVPERTVASRLAGAKRRMRGLLEPAPGRGGPLGQSAKQGLALAWPEGRHGYNADGDVAGARTAIGRLESTT
jgi:RNA polymerase sigma-70 factor (ECF subfamily)